MKMYKKVNHNEFAEYLMKHLNNIGDKIEFAFWSNADEDETEEDETEVEEFNLESWHFAKRIGIEKYNSNFILLDYCGGEEAYVIPLHNYNDVGFDEDDKRSIRGYVKKFFNQTSDCPEYVWVEVDNDEEE